MKEGIIGGGRGKNWRKSGFGGKYSGRSTDNFNVKIGRKLDIEEKKAEEEDKEVKRELEKRVGKASWLSELNEERF